MLSGSTSDHRRGIESPMDVDRKGPSIFAALSASQATATATVTAAAETTVQPNPSASESSTSTTGASAGTPASTSTSIFGSAAASTFKFEMPNPSPSPTLRSTATKTLAGLGDSFTSLRFSTSLSQSLLRDSGIGHDEQGNQGNGTDPFTCPTPTPKSSLHSNLDDSFDLSDLFSNTSPGSPDIPIKLNLDLDMASSDEHPDGPSMFDGTPLARPVRVARRLSKGFARRFTSSSAAAAAEASAQLDADELTPATPTRGKRLSGAPPRSSARTVTQKNVSTHHRSDADRPPPPSSPSPPPPSRTPLSSTPSTTPHRRPLDDPRRSTPGTNANHLHMPPPSSAHRPTATNTRSTPGANHQHQTPHRTPGHTPRLGNLNPTLTPRGTPRHKRPRRDYDSDHPTDYASGDDDAADAYDGAGDGSILYLGERFHGHNHQYVPAPPPMQHTPYGFAHQPHVWVQQPFYPYATPQGVHVHPQMMYGPPPVQPQFMLHAQGQGPFRRTHHMLNSDEDEDEDNGDDVGHHGLGGSETSLMNHHTHSRSGRGAAAPHVVVRSYMQSLKSIVVSTLSMVLVVGVVYLGYIQFMAKHAAHATRVQVEMQACARKFQENQCGASTGRPPLLADACLQWEQCMAKDPFKEVFYATVAAILVGEFADAFVTTLSTKTLVVFGVLAIGLVLAFRVSWCCGSARNKDRGRSKSRSRKQQQHNDDDGPDIGHVGGFQGGRRGQEQAPGEFMGPGPIVMGGTPMAIMGPPSSTARPMHQHRGYAPSSQQQQQPSPFATPMYQGGYFQDARTTPVSSGRMGMGSGFGQRQTQETPSRMPGVGTMRRRRQM